MKTYRLALILYLIPLLAIGQIDSTEVTRNLLQVEENHDNTNISIPGASLNVNHFSDTVTQIIIGHRRLEIIEEGPNDKTTRIRMVHVPTDRFKGHWEGVDIGFTNFCSDFFKSELPDDAKYLDLVPEKSIAVGLNLMQYSIGLQKNSNNLGMITGLGLTYNNYRFDSPYILVPDEDGNTSYVESSRIVKKNKLATTFLTVPLLLEYQVPNNSKYPFFFSGGFCGGFKLGSHTKVVYGDNLANDKEKSRRDLNVNSFKYGATMRVGYRFIKLHASMDLSRLFQAARGPQIYPWTVGVTLLNF
jgi:hypothetical protein